MSGMGASAKPMAALDAGLLARKGLARKPVLAADEGRAAVATICPPVRAEAVAGIPDVMAMQLARSERATKDKAAFTLRLDAERRMRLRLASAVTGRSAQQLVTEAIDSMLGEMTELESLARRIAAIEG
ncbi:hypothetical protein [Sphingomonas elodea]|uniref:hypothetical protein n=1 Tax=Sphingomonas elodea TaxID=179878 RepID=UPI0003025567|nr:hypothetical protein [Sphingomonas elodea]